MKSWNSCIILWAVSVPWLKNTAQIIVSCVPLLAVQAMQGQTLEWLMLHLGGHGCSLITAHPWPCRLWPHLEPFNDPVFAWGRMVLKLFHCWRQNAVSLNPPTWATLRNEGLAAGAEGFVSQHWAHSGGNSNIFFFLNLLNTRTFHSSVNWMQPIFMITIFLHLMHQKISRGFFPPLLSYLPHFPFILIAWSGEKKTLSLLH